MNEGKQIILFQGFSVILICQSGLWISADILWVKDVVSSTQHTIFPKSYLTMGSFLSQKVSSDQFFTEHSLRNAELCFIFASIQYSHHI